MPTFEPCRRLVVLSLLLTGGIYAGLLVGLGTLAGWAESRFEAYPYFGGEDPIRSLLPTVHAATDGGTLLLGPSAIGEAFLYEELEGRWNMRVRSGSLSNGTIDDYYLFLSYLERAYGANSLPRRIVLGMEPRVLANLPRLFGSRRVKWGVPYTIDPIDHYSTRFRVVRGELGTELVSKTAPEAVKAWLRFHLTKQQPRYQTGVLALLEHTLDPDPRKVGFQAGLGRFKGNLRRPFTPSNLGTAMSLVRSVGPGEAVMKWLRAYRSAYWTMFMQPMDQAEIWESLALEEMALEWDPRDEAPMVTMQLRRLAAFIERYGIELIVVYLPQHPSVRAGFDPAAFGAYVEALQRYLPTASFVNLWDAVPAELFFDNVHPTYEGARLATSLLIEAVSNDLLKAGHPVINSEAADGSGHD